MKSNKNIISLIIGNNVNTYAVSKKRGFNELHEEVKYIYGKVKKVDYDSGYYNPNSRKFEIIDEDLQDYDELKVLECIKKNNCEVMDKDDNSYQEYAGVAYAISYPIVYLLFNKNFNNTFIDNIVNYYEKKTPMRAEKKYSIIGEYLEYLNFNLVESVSIDKFLENKTKKDQKMIDSISNTSILLEDSQIKEFI